MRFKTSMLQSDLCNCSDAYIVVEETTTTTVPLRHPSNFWRTLDIPLINWEVFLTLAGSANGVLTSKPTRDTNPAVASVNNPISETFKITDTKFMSQLSFYQLKKIINY